MVTAGMSEKKKSITNSLFVLGLLLLSVSLTKAARPEPAVPNETQQQQLQQLELEGEQSEDMGVEGCGDECMMRRTLEAHLDYIYTQEKKN